MSKLSPWKRYQQDLTRANFNEDLVQEKVMQVLEIKYEQLIASQSNNWFEHFKQTIGLSQRNPVQGVYLWGGVGRGKTYLMDTFFHALPIEAKLREHFHHFMHRIHEALHELAGQSDPLVMIAKQIAQQYRVICFDEFFVSDITDAMLLGTLFTELFKHDVMLIATSNIPPDELYRNGLQRARFLPAIEQIKQHCQVINVDAGIDYRLRTLSQATIYHYPLDRQAKQNLVNYFDELTLKAEVSQQPLMIEGRPLRIQQMAQGVLLLDFRALCDGPRSQRDYMVIAHEYHTVLLDGVEQMGAQTTGDDIARRFLALVDEFYERQVKLIIAAEVSIEELYLEGQLSFEFNRCRSRLQEMQSEDYLALAHLA